MALLAPLYPRKPVDVSGRLRILPEDGGVPPMPGWRWVHTPGHAPGHVSLWRESDRSLIVGDAFVSTAQESAYAVAVQAPEIHGPPKYFPIDWGAARASVEALAALEPERAITGHGRPLRGRSCGAACRNSPAPSRGGAGARPLRRRTGPRRGRLGVSGSVMGAPRLTPSRARR